MNKRTFRWISQLLMLILIVAAVSGCGSDEEEGPEIPRNAEAITVLANASLAPWLQQAVNDFNALETKTAAERNAFIVLETAEAGQAVVALSEGESTPTMWIPDDMVWTAVLAEQGNGNYKDDCQSIAESPLVIGMWRPVAESLGWPGRELGWLDIGSLAADASAWEYYSGGQFGETLRLGHTHPGLSATGASTLLAIVQAAESKSEAVTVEDVEQPIVQASVGAFEAAVSWFSPSTLNLAETMRERGVQFLGAAVMYESTIAQFGGETPNIVPIYPFEGTYMATHPACIRDNATATQNEVAELFRDYLLSDEGQNSAINYGYRSVIDGVQMSEGSFPGVNLDQPQIVFDSPSVDSLFAAQALWQTARKPVNLVMLLDVSGSMRGDKIDNMKAAAVTFVEQMGGDDTISIIAFSDAPELIVQEAVVGQAREQVINAIELLEARGNTTLYDAIGEGARLIERYAAAGDVSHALIVLSDGEDTASVFFRSPSAEMLAPALTRDATVFTIAYGGDAEEALLEGIALQGNGNFYLGDEASIALIYEEMSAAFGGAVGIGR